MKTNFRIKDNVDETHILLCLPTIVVFSIILDVVKNSIKEYCRFGTTPQ